MSTNKVTLIVYVIIMLVLIVGNALGMPHPDDVNGVMYGLQWAQLLMIINLWVRGMRG